MNGVGERDGGRRPLRRLLLDPPWVLFQLTAVVLAAGALTLLHVHQPVTPPPFADDPTPLGYTWSLSLFALPLAFLVVWLLLRPEIRVQKRALGVTLAILVPLGVVLDLLFAHTFFTFENTGAVTGLSIPGRGGPIPIEELVFYLTGFVFVLLLYVWSDEAWMERYNPSLDAYATAPPVLRFHLGSVVTGLALLAAAILYRKLLSGDPDGFPWYWAYLLAASFVPSAGFFRTVRLYVNWQALSFTFALVLMISLTWEASLASPYGWWGYQPPAMMGLFIAAWSRLPVEAVFVWLAVTYTTVIVYEVVKIWQASGKGFKEAMLG